jgi:DNA ligase (NAD+)
MISGNSPTQKLVNQIQEGFNKAKHNMPMLSLENSYDAKDLEDRGTKLKKILEKSIYANEPLSYIVEPKIDGLSIELIYKN